MTHNKSISLVESRDGSPLEHEWTLAGAVKEIEVLCRWKEESIDVITQWESVWEALGQPGQIGSSKAAETKKEVERLRARVQRMEKLGPLIEELKQAALAFREDYEGDFERECADTTRLWTAEGKIDAILSGNTEATVSE